MRTSLFSIMTLTFPGYLGGGIAVQSTPVAGFFIFLTACAGTWVMSRMVLGVDERGEL